MLLDNAEDVTDAGTGEFGITCAALDEALRALLSAPAHGVKVILTTRVAPRGLLLVQPERQHLDLDEGLDSPCAEQVSRARDPDGRLGRRLTPGRSAHVGVLAPFLGVGIAPRARVTLAGGPLRA